MEVIFLISSHQIKEPKRHNEFVCFIQNSIFEYIKIIIKTLANRQVSCISIAPGPIATDRLKNLVSDLKSLEDRLPMKRIGKVEELSKFVRSIIENEIKYLTGVTMKILMEVTLKNTYYKN